MSAAGDVALERAVAPPATKTPTLFLRNVLGRAVVVKLNNGAEYRGKLVCLDGYLNIVLENTAEFVNGELKRRYGDTLLRGSNVLYVGTASE
jgi:U6 snRNA-associated Sm-like protein LSm6